MRILLITLIGLLNLSSISASTSTHSEVWVNEKHQLKVKFKFYQSKIKAKNLTNRGWQTFRRIEPGVYSNYRGDRIIKEAADIIVFSSRRQRRNIVFRPPFVQRTFDRDRTALGGTWKVPSLNRTLYISNTRDGIEARLEGQSKWTSYIRKDRNFFVDRDGNSYTIKSESELFWESRDGRKSFVLIR